MTPTISVIAAIGKNKRAICQGQNLLWVIPDDHKRLKALTMGHTLVLGRKTYESIGHPLRGRFHVIVTKDKNYKPSIPPGYENELVKTSNSTDEALEVAKNIEMEHGLEDKKVYIFGGGEIYAQTISKADELNLTIVDSDVDEEKGTAFFPEYEKEFEITNREEGVWNNKSYSWVDFKRKTKATLKNSRLSLLGVV